MELREGVRVLREKEIKRSEDFYSFVCRSAGRFGLILIKENGGCNGKLWQQIPRHLTLYKLNSCLYL